GNPSNPNSNDINFQDGDGLLLISEAGYSAKGDKLGGGVWEYNKDFDHYTLLDGNGDPVQESNQGVYVIGEKEIYSEAEGQGLSAFARFGTANGEVSQFDYSWSTGVTYTGLIPGRDEGQLGFGFTGAHNSSEY